MLTVTSDVAYALVFDFTSVDSFELVMPVLMVKLGFPQIFSFILISQLVFLTICGNIQMSLEMPGRKSCMETLLEINCPQMCSCVSGLFCFIIYLSFLMAEPHTVLIPVALQ